MEDKGGIAENHHSYLHIVFIIRLKEYNCLNLLLVNKEYTRTTKYKKGCYFIQNTTDQLIKITENVISYKIFNLQACHHGSN